MTTSRTLVLLATLVGAQSLVPGGRSSPTAGSGKSWAMSAESPDPGGLRMAQWSEIRIICSFAGIKRTFGPHTANSSFVRKGFDVSTGGTNLLGFFAATSSSVILDSRRVQYTLHTAFR